MDLTQEAIDELESTGVIPSDRSRSSRQPVPTPGLTAASVEEELRAREARLAERERQIAEQQRVINEQYRLLKLRTERSLADPSINAEWAWPPPASAARADGTAASRTSAMAPVSVAAPVPTQQRIVMPKREVPVDVDSATRDGSLWSRVRRTLFGDSKPAF